MLTITDNPAFKRALVKAHQTEPKVTEILPDWTYSVTGSKGDVYRVEFCLLDGKLAASCTCPAHTGLDPQGFRAVPPNYIPRDCYHIASCYDYRRKKVAEAAEVRAKAANYRSTANKPPVIIALKCFWCGSKTHDKAEPLVIARGYYQHPTCQPVEEETTAQLCEDCQAELATIEGSLCPACYDAMRYSDLAGASRF